MKSSLTRRGRPGNIWVGPQIFQAATQPQKSSWQNTPSNQQKEQGAPSAECTPPILIWRCERLRVTARGMGGGVTFSGLVRLQIFWAIRPWQLIYFSFNTDLSCEVLNAQWLGIENFQVSKANTPWVLLGCEICSSARPLFGNNHIFCCSIWQISNLEWFQC